MAVPVFSECAVDVGIYKSTLQHRKLERMDQVLAEGLSWSLMQGPEEQSVPVVDSKGGRVTEREERSLCAG